ncbi:SMC4 SMC4 [Cryptosporidium sp. chipmunk genotype I]|uniref:SMC4 SMC4 n=1 Tax=Cryptosporidium sp. chipmunk genotype I TaxID=1280935 RepID=UPI00351A35DC|nr:SMC4 SMC4 [Cryptosporidium sp. chipmunk genotype I]
MENIGIEESRSVCGEQEKPRLIIHKIVLENFKSYGGNKVIGPFHKSFTAIVGPNGSGKSNVIDAMLFVFGKRARHMRLNKVSELIHNSKHYPNNDKASVAVHFKEIIDIPGDEHAYKIVPNSEIVIKREVQKNSEQTKYYINEKLSSYQEVTKLLSRKGTDLEHNRFLILQGEVELIAQMKPKSTNANEDGLLEYIEDIIGSSRFIPDIEKHSIELEQFNELRQEKLNRLKITEKELNTLKAPYNMAIEFFTLEREICIAKLLLHFEEQRDAIKHLNALKDEQNKQLNLRGELNYQKKALEDKRVKLEVESKETNSRVNELKVRLEKEENEFNNILLKDEELRATLKNSKKRLTKLEESTEGEKKLIPELEQKIIDLEDDIRKKQKQLPKITKDLDSAQEKLELLQKNVKDGIEESRKKKDRAEQELTPLQKQLLALQQSHDILNIELDMLKQRLIQRQESEENSKKEKENTVKRIQALNKQNKDVSKSLEDSKTLLDEKSKKLEQLQKDLNENSKLLGLKKVELDEARSLLASNNHLEIKSVSELKQKGSKLSLTETVIKHFSASKKSGVHGRLGDLGTVDDEFQLALVSSVPQIENIVVQTTEDAQEVVNYVRNSNLGRVSCIILEKLSASVRQNMEKPFKAPDKSKRFFDLVKFKSPEFKIAWYFAMRDTLIVDNLDIATKISYGGEQRWRVVTVNGELIDSSGTMTGGGSNVSAVKHAGKKGEKAPVIPTPEQLTRLEADFEASQSRCNQIKSECKNLEDHVQNLKNDINGYTITLEKIKIELASIEETERSRSEIQPEIGQESPTNNQAETMAEISRLESEIEGLKKQISTLEASLKQKQTVVDCLTKEMNEIGGPEMKKQSEFVQELTNTIGTLESEISKSQVEISLSEKKKLKAIDSIEQFRNKAIALRETIDKTESELVSLEEVALKVMESRKLAEEELNSFLSENSSFQARFEEIEREIEKLELRDVELSNKLNDISAKISEVESQNIKQLQKKLQKVRADASCIPSIPEIEPEKDEQPVPGQDAELESLKSKFLLQDVQDTEYEKILGEMTFAKLKPHIESLQTQLQTICEQYSNGGSIKQFRPSPDIFSQYSSQLQLFNRRNQEVEEATNARDESRRHLDTVRQARHSEFISGFKVIASQLKEIYQMITLGGDAELELIDSVDPFSDGIIFSVRPPKKSWRPIHNLSGGEKTLSSLALVFALHQFRPSPLYFMDEVDAALDFRNVSIIATFIKEKTKNAQFIVVSLRNHMFEMADRLVGIYKTFDITKSVSILPANYSSHVKNRTSVHRERDNGEGTGDENVLENA